RSFVGFAVGETVRVTGIAYQYCPMPPHLDQFELLIGDVKDVVPLRPRWAPQLGTLWPILVVLGAMGFLWWRREIPSHHQRETLRTIYHLGEEILGAASSAEILNKITAALPKILKVTGARLYIYDRGTKTLVPVGEAQSSALSIDAPSGLAQTSVLACFQNRTLLAIPDTR